jgi:hypothetical protein
LSVWLETAFGVSGSGRRPRLGARREAGESPKTQAATSARTQRTRTKGRIARQDRGAWSASAIREPAEGTLLDMDDATRKALEAIDAAVAAKPPEGPIVLSEEYLRLVRRVEEIPENKPGTDKTWTERVVDEWKHLVESAREIPPG